MRFDHVGVYCSSLAEASAMAEFFAGQQIGAWQSPTSGLRARIYRFDSHIVEFIEDKQRENYGLDHLAYTTPELSKAVARITQQGGKLKQEFVNDQGQRIAFLLWNETVIELLEKKED